ncbi:MAG: glutamate racemase [bacterium]|nr:glutamate racemase [bacterium]
MDTRAIGIWDSGLGGLTVVRAVAERLPGERLVYFGDSARVPYGTKSAQTVRRFARQNSEFLLTKGLKLMVVACNTASALALEELQELLDIPVIGVIEPGARAAAAATRTGIVGVIGTPGTIQSGAYNAALRECKGGLSVVSRECPLFVPLAEEGWLMHPATRLTAEEYLNPVKQAGVDTLVLGCTHYPVLRPLIGEVMGQDVRLVDSAEETAREVEARLDKLNLKSADESAAELECYVSDMPSRFRQAGELFLGRRIENVALVEYDKAKENPWQ